MSSLVQDFRPKAGEPDFRAVVPMRGRGWSENGLGSLHDFRRVTFERSESGVCGEALQLRFHLIVIVGRELQSVPKRIAEVDGIRLIVVDQQVSCYTTSSVIGQVEFGKPPQKFRKGRCSDPKRNQVEPRCFS